MTTMMMRVSGDTHAALHELANIQGTSMQEVLRKAVEAYRRQQLIDATHAAYAALRSNDRAWQEFQNDIRSLDGALLDGLGSPYEGEGSDGGHLSATASR